MKIHKQNVKDILPLTPMQEGLLFHYLAQEKTEYLEHLVIHTEKKIEESVFLECWNQITADHDALRSVFKWKKLEKPVQIILHEKQPKLLIHSQDETEDINWDESEKAIEQEIQERDIKLDEAPFYLILCQYKDKSSIHLVFHHILMDGWSVGILIKQFLKVYKSLLTGEEMEQVKYGSFKDYVVARENLSSKEEEKEYWSELLKGYQIKSGVRPLFKNKEASVFKRIDWKLPEGLYEEMEQFCRNYHVTMANLFYSAWGLMAQRFIYDTDIVFGTTVSGRNVEVPDIENTVGLFINTVPLRIKPEPLQTVEEFVLSVQRSCVKHQKFEQTSLTAIGQYAGIQASELFDSIVVIENYPLQVEKLVDAGSKGFTITGFAMEEYTNYPLTVIVDANNQYQIKLLFDTDMYEIFTVESMLESLTELLKDMVRNAKKPVKELNMLSYQAKIRIIEEFNDTITDYPREENIVSLFQQIVKETPHHTAIMYEGKAITYKDLDQKSDKLAVKLVQAGTKPGQCVGIMCNRSPEVYVGLLGILKSRGVYVPINPEYPKERKELMLQEIKADILLCNCGYEPDCNVQVIDLNEEITIDEPEKYLKDLPKIQPDNLAYIIYTSGSTGRPKGIMIEHKSVVRLVRKTNFITIRKEDRILPTSPLEFDVSTFEIWMPILNGAESWLLDKKKMLSIQLLEEFIVENKISMMWMTTPLFNQIAQVNPYLFQTIRYLIIGGDALSPYHVAKVRKACKDLTLVNGYGPTENTVFSTTFEIIQDYESRVPIGRPIANSTVYIVDTYGHLAPIGAVGELCAGLDGVGRGYFGNEKLTKEKFVEDIVFPGRKMYRSGDLARFLPDGVVDFFGRKDYQVKIRGFRIELTEIESVLNQYDKVKDCAVIATDKDEFDKMLVAFVQKKTEISIDELRKYMTEHVPAHCVPSVFVLLDELPFTENGKIDRKALKNMQNVEVEVFVPDVAESESETEKKVKEIWERILKRPATGLNINFFEMGGTSLHMIQMSSQLEKEFHQSVTVVDLFTYTTIRKLSRYLERKQAKYSSELELSEESKKIRQEEGKQTGKEEIAVIGMAGRFPGANTLKRFYENICDGRECISFFTKEELEGEVDGSLLENDFYVRAKGVIEGSEYFDARMFGYSDREAEFMDPQVRLLHECVFHAFEDGGYMNEKVRKTGLFVGASPNFEWLMRIQSDTDDDTATWEAANLNYHSLAAPVAYKLNMQGPVVMNSTACSSSLVALHLACRSLLEGECEMAVAGGVSVSLPIKSGYTYQEGMIRSKDGRCRPFREDSDGTTTGDGVGAVLLKPLSKAIKDKDYIYAVIKGSAMNNDGSRKAGFTAPSVDGQCQVIRSALNAAGVTGEQVRYIETHGTGTPIGDAIELRALKETYGAEKKVEAALGSVKANIGHLDCAAGIAGFIKTALCLEQGIIPPCVHEGVPNKWLNKDCSFYLNERLKKWDLKEGIYQAGISSFGIGGTNVHMILEEPPVRVEKQEKADKWNVVPISALTKESLYRQCMEYIKASNNNLILLESIVSGLQIGRKKFDYRISFLVDSKESLNEQLSETVANGVSRMKATCTKEKRPVVFLFPGQGTQYFGVCKELYQGNRLYHDIFDDCISRLSRDHFSTKGFLLGDDKYVITPEEMNQTQNAQPLLFVMEYTLAMTLIKLGIQPDAMIGHSLGEYAAAAVSGVITFEECFELVVARAKLMQKMETGRMVSVAASAEEIRDVLGQQVKYDIAAINAPDQIVISGTDKDIELAKEILEEKNIALVSIHVSHAFHSRMMEPMLDEFRTELRKVHWKTLMLPYISNYTGVYIKAEEATSPEYYVKHLRNSVLFEKGVENLRKFEGALFVEVGAGDVLTRLVNRCIGIGNPIEAASMLPGAKQKADGSYQFAKCLSFLWEKGCAVNWNALYEGRQVAKQSLPGYCFNRKKYWKYGNMIYSRGTTDVRKKETVNSLSLYEPVWIPVDKPDDCKVPQTFDRYVILAEQDTFSQALEERITQSGKFCFKNSYEETDWIANLPVNAKESIKVLLILSGDNHPEELDSLLENYKKAREYLMNVIAILKKLHQRYQENEVSVLMITSGMEKTKSTEIVNPFRTMLKGIVITAEQEYANFRFGCLDVERKNVDSYSKAVMDGLNIFLEDPVKNKFQVFRSGQFMALHYVLKEQEPQIIENEDLKYHGVYLVTGGLGGIGLSIASHLASQYAATIILLTHSEFPERAKWEQWIQEHDRADGISGKIKQILEFEEQGATVWVRQTSLSDPDTLSKVIVEANKVFLKIDGVFHTAGIGDQTFIDFLTEEHIDKILEPKVMGIVCLYQQLMKQTKEKPGFVALFSSLASITGGIGQTAYACANAFLDGFTEMAESYGIPAVSTNWDTWKEIGMAVRAAKELEKQMENRREGRIASNIEKVKQNVLGEHGIHTKDGISILFQQIKGMHRTTSRRMVVTDGELFSQSEIQSELLTHIEASASTKKKARPVLKNEYEKPVSEIEARLVCILEDFTGISQVGVNDNFFELGITSLDIIQINNKINKIYTKDSSIVKLYTYPTCRQLANYISGTQKEENREEFRKNQKELKFGRKKTVDILNRRRCKS